jgi:hypothetical protein
MVLGRIPLKANEPSCGIAEPIAKWSVRLTV